MSQFQPRPARKAAAPSPLDTPLQLQDTSLSHALARFRTEIPDDATIETNSAPILPPSPLHGRRAMQQPLTSKRCRAALADKTGQAAIDLTTDYTFPEIIARLHPSDWAEHSSSEAFIAQCVASALKRRAKETGADLPVTFLKYEEAKTASQGNGKAHQHMASKLIHMLLFGLETKTVYRDYEFLFWLAARYEVDELVDNLQHYRQGLFTREQSVEMVTDSIDDAVNIMAGVSKQKAETIYSQLEEAKLRARQEDKVDDQEAVADSVDGSGASELEPVGTMGGDEDMGGVVEHGEVQGGGASPELT